MSRAANRILATVVLALVCQTCADSCMLLCSNGGTANAECTACENCDPGTPSASALFVCLATACGTRYVCAPAPRAGRESTATKTSAVSPWAVGRSTCGQTTSRLSKHTCRLQFTVARSSQEQQGQGTNIQIMWSSTGGQYGAPRAGSSETGLESGFCLEARWT